MSGEKKGLWAMMRDAKASKAAHASANESPHKPLTSIDMKDKRSLARQRNASLLGNAALIATIFSLSTLMAARQEKVILVPGIISQYDLGGRDLPIKYLEDLALQVGTVFFNRHPDDNEFYEQNAFRLSDVSFHDDLKKLLEQERENRFSTQSSQIFRVHRMNTIPADLSVELHGVRETIIGDQITKREGKIYRIEFIRNGWELKLKDVFEIQQKQSIDNPSNNSDIIKGGDQ